MARKPQLSTEPVPDVSPDGDTLLDEQSPEASDAPTEDTPAGDAAAEAATVPDEGAAVRDAADRADGSDDGDEPEDTEPEDAEPEDAEPEDAEPRHRRRLADLSIRTRIIGVALSLALVTALVSGYGLLSLMSAAEGTRDVVDMTTGMVADANRAGQATQQSLANVRKLEKVDSDVARKQSIDALAASDKAAADAIAAFETSSGTRVVAAWDEFVAGWAEYLAYRDSNIVEHLTTGGTTVSPIIESVAQTKVDTLQAAFAEATIQINTYADEVAAAADARASRSVVILIGVALAGIAVALAAGFALAAMISRPVNEVRRNLDDLAEGDLTFEVTVDQRDEVGQMADALKIAQGRLRPLLTEVIDTTYVVASSATEMAASSTQMRAGVAETSAQAGVVAAAAEEVSRNVQAVAAGAEQMGASIREIAQNANEAARVATKATEVATETNVQIARLGTSSREIGNVVKTITQIAEQTNLLALNATIEAARAGEAGKGFAVVAGEVKELAQETGRATEDIARRVDAIQADTKHAIDAIAQITEIIGSINDFQLTIASAVEEQTATTNEISRGVSEVATGSGEIAEGITAVAEAARMSTEVLTGVGETIDDLAVLAERLRSGVAAFTV